jgi:CubicO group peptidase (beta-lactamase class C family)
MIRGSVRVAFAVFFLLLCSLGLSAASNSIDETAAFFKSRIPELMKERHIAGATFSFVANGKIIAAEGFGYADVEKEKTVSAESTLFRAGSISKLFVWTALMQLYEKGLVDLDADINSYLGDFKIPDAFGKPITIKNLMSHTPGFGDNTLGLFTKDRNKLETLESVILHHMPERIFPPGTQIAYSNYGATLGGYIVERVSKMPFEEYVKKNIFEPLDMKHSTFRQPVDDELFPGLSQAYVYANGKFLEQGFEYVQGTPAGGISTSAKDMANFMIAHLQNGELRGKRILGSGTAALMHEKSFSYDPRMNGFAHGFIEVNMNNERIIGHGGDTIYFHSLLVLMPEEKLGIYLSSNTANGAAITIPLFREYLDKFYPGKQGAALAQSDPNKKPDYKKYAGVYRVNRRDESDFLKLMSLAMTTYVSVSKDGKAIEISDILSGGIVRCVEVEPGIFQEENGSRRYDFPFEAGDRYSGLLYDYIPVFTFLRAPFWEQLGFNAVIVILMILLVLIGIIARPTGLLSFVGKKGKQAGLERVASLAGTFLIISYISFIIVLVVQLFGDFIFNPINPLFYTALYTSLPCAAAMILFTVLAWMKKYWHLVSRVYYSLLCLSAVGFTWFAVYWKLIF